MPSAKSAQRWNGEGFTQRIGAGKIQAVVAAVALPGAADITRTSWSPEPLESGHAYELEVAVVDGSALQPYSGATDQNDNFEYSDLFLYENTIRFTTISSPEARIEEALTYFEEAVADEELVGTGPSWLAKHQLNALRWMLQAGSDLIDHGLYPSARVWLCFAYRKCDGQPMPADYVTGDATQELAAKIQSVIDSLGYE